MSDPAKKTAPKKPPTMKAPAATTASVRDLVAQASHLREVVAIIRAASIEFISRFNGIGRELPELLLQRDGCGARPASVEALLATEAALEGVARELDARANELLATPVEQGDAIEHHAVSDIGVDRIVHRDNLDRALRPPIEKSFSHA